MESIKTIKLKATLSAYTKLDIPELTKNIVYEAPDDDKLYGRKNKQWEEIILPKGNKELRVKNGLNLETTDEAYILSIKQQTLLNKDLPKKLEEDTTYYVIDNTPDFYMNGGTAYSDEIELINNKEYSSYRKEMFGGDSTTKIFDIDLLPIDNKGVYNG